MVATQGATAAIPATAATAAFSIQGVDLQPDVVPPGGTVRLAIDVLNTQPQVTAGDYQIQRSAYTAQTGSVENQGLGARGATSRYVLLSMHIILFWHLVGLVMMR